MAVQFNMKNLTRVLIHSGAMILASGTLLMNVNAGLMHYVGMPFSGGDDSTYFTGTSGSLAQAHHVEAVVEFNNVADSQPVSISARVVDGSGATLMEIQSSGPIGTDLWTATFSWVSGQIQEWAWVVHSSDGSGGTPVDYISSLSTLDILHASQTQGQFYYEDQAIDGATPSNSYGDGQATAYGFGVYPRGTWRPVSSVPEAGSTFAFLGLSLASLIGFRRRTG